MLPSFPKLAWLWYWTLPVVSFPQTVNFFYFLVHMLRSRIRKVFPAGSCFWTGVKFWVGEHWTGPLSVRIIPRNNASRVPLSWYAQQSFSIISLLMQVPKNFLYSWELMTISILPPDPQSECSELQIPSQDPVLPFLSRSWSGIYFFRISYPGSNPYFLRAL